MQTVPYGVKIPAIWQVDPKKLVKVVGGHSPWATNSHKEYFVIKFIGQDGPLPAGTPVIIQRTKDVRRYYSMPRDGGDGSHMRSNKFGTVVLAPYNAPKEIIRVWKMITDPREFLPSVHLVLSDTKRTSLGGQLYSIVEGEGVGLLAYGYSSSPTGNHGNQGYLVLVPHGANAQVHKTWISNTGRCRESVAAIA